MTTEPNSSNPDGPRSGALAALRSAPPLALAVIALALATGTWWRTSDLDAGHFGSDEATHYFTARSIAEGRGPMLPAGTEYTRGIDITRMSVWSGALFDDREQGARAPSALFGVIALVLFTTIGWAMGGPWLAAAAATLLAIYPETIAESRRLRFYTYQLCFGLVAMYAAWRSLRAAWPRPDPPRAVTPDVRSTWLWAAVAGVFLLGAARIQAVSLVPAVAWGLCMVGIGALQAMRDGLSGWRANPGLQMGVLGAAGLLAIAIVRPEIYAWIVATASYVPLWSGAKPDDPRAYYWAITLSFPLFFSLLPVSLLAAARRDVRLAAFLGAWFGVPFLMLSLIFPWKAERYLLIAMMGFLMLSAMLVESGARALAAALRHAGPPLLQRAAPAIVAACLLFVLVTTPAFNRARTRPNVTKHLDWTAAATVIDETRGAPDAGRWALGSSMPLPPLVYWPGLDFHVGIDFMEIEADGRVFAAEDGKRDEFAGVPGLTRPASIRAAFPDASGVFIAIDPDRWHYGNIDPALKVVLMEQAEEVCQDRCLKLLLFKWRFERDPAPS